MTTWTPRPRGSQGRTFPCPMPKYSRTMLNHRSTTLSNPSRKCSTNKRPSKPDNTCKRPSKCCSDYIDHRSDIRELGNDVSSLHCLAVGNSWSEFASLWKSVSVHTNFFLLRSNSSWQGLLPPHIYCLKFISAIDYPGFCYGVLGQHGCLCAC